MNDTTKKSKEIIQLGITDKALNELKEKFSVVPDATTADGYNDLKSGISTLVKVRTSVEKARKEKKADALEFGRRVDKEANRIKEILLSMETPMKDAKKAVDDETARIEEEKRQAEIKRIDAIKDRIAAIKSVTDNLLNADSHSLKQSIDALNSTVISEKNYGEFCDVAEEALTNTVVQLQIAFTARVALEEQQAENERIREEQEAEAKRLAEEQEKIKEQQQAEAEKLKEQQDKLDEQQRKIDEEKKRQEDDKRAAEQAELDRIKAENDRLENEAREAREAEEKAELEEKERKRLEELKPDAEKLQQFAHTLFNLDYPILKDQECRLVLDNAVSGIERIHSSIMNSLEEITRNSAA